MLEQHSMTTLHQHRSESVGQLRIMAVLKNLHFGDFHTLYELGIEDQHSRQIEHNLRQADEAGASTVVVEERTHTGSFRHNVIHNFKKNLSIMKWHQ